MIASLWNGISGINTYANAIAVESNDMSNVSTVGHKKSDVRFEDLMYSNGQGSGVTTQSVNKVFTQGDIKLTNISYDLAIRGDGFFVGVDTADGESYYTRAGNFKMGPNGYLLTSDNLQVQGASVNPFTVKGSAGSSYFDDSFSDFIASAVIQNTSSSISINARSTNYIKTASDVGLSGDGFKNKASVLSDIEALKADYQNKLDIYNSNPNAVSVPSTSQVTVVNFDTIKSTLSTDLDRISISIDGTEIAQNFDTDADTTMNLFADKISSLTGLSASVDASGILTITSLIPGKEVLLTSPKINDKFPEINNTVSASIGSGVAMVDSSRNELQKAIELAGGKLLEMTNSVSISSEENLSMTNINLKLDSLGISDSAFGSFEVVDGNIYLKDGDNKFLVGKLTTVRFADNRGLMPVGDNNFTATAESGDARYSANTSEIISKSLELSTSNLGENLTHLLVLQKAFEANSKIITTSDEFLKTAIGLKK